MGSEGSRRLPIAAFITLGCKANRYDTAAMMAMVPADSFLAVDMGGAVDEEVEAAAYVVNTCAVTRRGEMQCLQMIRRARRVGPAAKIIAAGCLAEVSAPALLEAGADAAVGPSQRERVIELLTGKVLPRSPVFYHPEGGLQKGKGRALVKIQDGCDFNCAYCIVTVARGPSRSVPMAEVVRQLRGVARAGFREAVLTGVHIGLYGKEWGKKLSDLLKLLAGSRDMPARIRLSSIEPQELTDDLIEAAADSGLFCSHFHVPLQSGDDEVLTRMGRPYKVDAVRRAVWRLKEAMPRAGLGMDVIAGFPGETEREHSNCLDFITELPVTYLHVFPYSRRTGTAADAMPGHLDPETIKARAAELRKLGKKKRAAFLEEQVGFELETLGETEMDGKIFGTSDNYLRVGCNGGADMVGNIYRVEIYSHDGAALWGDKIEPNGRIQIRSGVGYNITENGDNWMGNNTESLEVIQDKIGYRFKNGALFERAMTHSSFAHEVTQSLLDDGREMIKIHYERLEFLGDAVLGLVVSHMLMLRFSGAAEGELSRIRAGLVNCDRLADLARDLGLGNALRLGKGEKLTGGADKTSILEDAFESLMGAIYLDGGFDETFKVIERLFQPLLDSLPPIDLLGDYKTPFQERVQALYKSTPVYRVIEEQGPDHMKTFEVEVKVEGITCGLGKGKSKKEAEQEAARNALLSGKFDE